MEWIDHQALQKVDYVHVRFNLEFSEDFQLTPRVLLQLRRELKTARDLLLSCCEDKIAGHLKTLLNPGENSDPYLRRTYPVLPPAFVIKPPRGMPIDLHKGDCIPLEVLFWGDGCQLIGAFHTLLTTLGQVGFHFGSGCFALLQTEAQTADGCWTELFPAGEALKDPPLPFLSAADLIGQPGPASVVTFYTTARLLVKGRPLFNPNFGSLLPFFLRRVTVMCHAWCGVDLVPHPAELLATFGAAGPFHGTLQWKDWRTLDKGYATQELGGLLGSFELPDRWQSELSLLFFLGGLLNLGKGAAYGGGAMHFS